MKRLLFLFVVYSTLSPEPFAMGERLPESGVPSFTGDGFRIPQPNTELKFPRSHASHPDFRIEWWYLTGHLFSEEGRRFGYQATFFRTALQPEASTEEAFGNNQLYLAHMALTDATSQVFYFDSKLAREGWDAFAKTDRLAVRNGPWSLTGLGDPFPLKLEGSTRTDASWSIQLESEKPLVRFGSDGTSRKGPSPEARSYYLSFTRLKTKGTIVIGDRTFQVNGSSWMDHEIASNQLDASLTGWDWIAIQLEDGWEVKAYLLRRDDGSASPFSACIWISPTGDTFTADRGQFDWNKGKTWKSESTGTHYPVRPTITSKHPQTGSWHTFRFEPIVLNQELDLPGSTYWEGAGDVLNENGQTIGSAYLELVGYAGAVEGLR